MRSAYSLIEDFSYADDTGPEVFKLKGLHSNLDKKYDFEYMIFMSAKSLETDEETIRAKPLEWVIKRLGFVQHKNWVQKESMKDDY